MKSNQHSSSLPTIKVIGVGGAGGNAVSRMTGKIRGIEFIAVNTDLQDLDNTSARVKIPIGKAVTRGMGAGMNPEVGRQAAEENREDILRSLEGADLVFITCGLGGGTGSGGAPVVAECSREVGALSVAVVTKPFVFEGTKRQRVADEAWKTLSSKVDAIITVPNDRVFNIISRTTPLLEAFERIDDILRQAVQGMSDLIARPGFINVDFADIRSVMTQAGPAILGIGEAGGQDRAAKAAAAAIQSPLLDLSIDGAKGVVFNIAGRENMGMAEVNEVAKIITESVDSDARIIFGATVDSRLRATELKVTVIAAGFGSELRPLPLETGAHQFAAAEFGQRTPGRRLAVDHSVEPRPSSGATQAGAEKDSEIGTRSAKDNRREPKPGTRALQDLLDQKLADNSEFDTPAFFRRKKK